MTPKRMNQILKISLLALVLLTAIGLYFGNKTLTNVAADTALLKAEVEVGQKQIAGYQKTKAQVDSLSYVEGLAQKVLPADKDQSAIITELSQFALRSNLTVSQINFNDTKTVPGAAAKKTTLAVPKGVDVIPITVQLKSGARYDNLLEFLTRIENNRRKMQVTNIALSPDAADRSKLSQVTININLYSRATQPASGAKP